MPSTPASNPPPAAHAGAAASILDAVLDATRTAAAAPFDAPGRLRAFLAEPDWRRALLLWLAPKAGGGLNLDTRHLRAVLGSDIAAIDSLLSDQVNAILHHPAFQKLEASWRGLHFLVQKAAIEHDEQGDRANVIVKVLNVSWRELARDAERAVDFDQSELWRKVYENEFGMPGGLPISAIVGDYEVRHKTGPGYTIDDLAVLRSLSGVAAGAFCPMIFGAHPTLVGLEHFGQLERSVNLTRVFQAEEYVRWRSFRDGEDARFIGLALPRVLVREPYDDSYSSSRITACKSCGCHLDGLSDDHCPRCSKKFNPRDAATVDRRLAGFRFREDVEGPDRRKYLWGNAAFAFGAVLLRAFAECSWLADIRGFTRGVEGGGLVTGLPVHSFDTDRAGVATKSSTEVVLPDMLEKDLSDHGFIPLCHCRDTDYSVFYSNQSVQKHQTYDTSIATMNARLSTMLQYMLCVSRFAHYLKVMGRDKIGRSIEAKELQDFLNEWLNRYVTTTENVNLEVRARYPLREARATVQPHPASPGKFDCVVHLLPHHQLDTLTASVKFRTEIAPVGSG